MIECSRCSQPYPFTRFLLIGNPFSLRCPHCQVVLRGGRETRRIIFWALLAILVVAVFGIFMGRVLELPSRTGLVVVLIGSASIGSIAGLLVWWRGDFRHETQNVEKAAAEFVAAQLEKLLALPLVTDEDEQRWGEACACFETALESRFPAFELEHHVHHFFTDTDIRRKDRGYRDRQHRAISEYIWRLRFGN